MFKFRSRSHHKQNTEQKIEQTIDKHALLFGLVSVFLCGIGFSIIAPVVPFLVQPYISRPGEQAIVVTLLTSVYAFCVFFASPYLVLSATNMVVVHYSWYAFWVPQSGT